MAVSPETTAVERPKVIKATRARQGMWGRHMLWVLIISTALAFAALFISLAFNADRLSGPGGQTTVTPPPPQMAPTVTVP